MKCVLKSVYEKARTYDRKDAFELLGDCSLAQVVLCDDELRACESDDGIETGWVWLAVSGTTWVAAAPRVGVSVVL